MDLFPCPHPMTVAKGDLGTIEEIPVETYGPLTSTFALQ